MESLSLWNNPQLIKELYEDGTMLNSDSTKKTYWDFVRRVYISVGGNAFFDEFVAKNYKREIKIWRHQWETKNELRTDQEIQHILKTVQFDEFDFDQDENIDFIEFQRCFRTRHLQVDQEKLQKIFYAIDSECDKDGKISRQEFKQWKKHYLKSIDYIQKINTELKDDEDVHKIVEKVRFEQFDFNNDEAIDFGEFQRCFKERGFHVEKTKLRKIFDVIEAEGSVDEKISRSELSTWKSKYLRGIEKRRKSDANGDGALLEERDPLTYVYFNEQDGRYEFQDIFPSLSHSESMAKNIFWSFS